VYVAPMATMAHVSFGTGRRACLALLPLVASLHVMVPAQEGLAVPSELPASAATQLARSLADSKAHGKHVWRDTPALNEDGTVNAYVEISRGDRRKWEFDMAANARAIDRIMPESVGGYPVNYGIVPQTISYDGDPFDALVLGPPIPGGRLVRGVIVGLLLMEDEKGWDGKVVLSLTGRDRRPRHALTEREQRDIAAYFRRYKEHEPGKFSKVPGWGSIAEGLGHVKTTHAFFRECRQSVGPCRLSG
jgi:inorganic pyrophosphatase